MKRVVLLAFAAALFFHLAILLFGGLVLFHPKTEARAVAEVDLLADAAEEKKDEKKDEEKPKAEAADQEAQDALQQQTAMAPDLRDLRSLESPSAAPALAAMSLSDLESALGGATAGGGGEFGGGFSLSSGGRIGGTGTEGGGGGGFGDALSAAELDQRPRPIFQSAPQYPIELRKQKVAGTVNVLFYVDKDGHVTNAQVENSTHPSFERPALEAVRQWRFEAGTRNGQRVSFKMRVPISFHVG